MEIKCKHCGEWFIPSGDNLDLIAARFIFSDTVNTCPDCWDLIELSEYDFSESYNDFDP
jgi:phage terminase large subunit GpA-like protein